MAVERTYKYAYIHTHHTLQNVCGSWDNFHLASSEIELTQVVRFDSRLIFLTTKVLAIKA